MLIPKLDQGSKETAACWINLGHKKMWKCLQMLWFSAGTSTLLQPGLWDPFLLIFRRISFGPSGTPRHNTRQHCDLKSEGSRWEVGHLKVSCRQAARVFFAGNLQTCYKLKLPKTPAKILVYFLTSQKSLMLVFYIFGFYMILLILTVIVLLMLYCLDFMPWVQIYNFQIRHVWCHQIQFVWFISWQVWLVISQFPSILDYMAWIYVWLWNISHWTD